MIVRAQQAAEMVLPTHVSEEKLNGLQPAICLGRATVADVVENYVVIDKDRFTFILIQDNSNWVVQDGPDAESLPITNQFSKFSDIIFNSYKSTELY